MLYHTTATSRSLHMLGKIKAAHAMREPRCSQFTLKRRYRLLPVQPLLNLIVKESCPLSLFLALFYSMQNSTVYSSLGGVSEHEVFPSLQIQNPTSLCCCRMCCLVCRLNSNKLRGLLPSFNATLSRQNIKIHNTLGRVAATQWRTLFDHHHHQSRPSQSRIFCCSSLLHSTHSYSFGALALGP